MLKFKIITLLFPVLFVFQDTTISWNESKSLEWSDFKGKPDLSSDAAAITASGLTFNYGISKQNDKIDGFTTHVVADFYPEHSWSRKDQVTNHILSHEQFHFNITELHSRMLRAAFSKLKVNPNIESQIQRLHEKYSKLLEQMQNAYDRDTDYSRKVDEQNRWESKISNSLQEFDNYKL